MTNILYIRNKKDVLLNNFISHLDPGKFHIEILDLAHGEFINYSSGKTKRILKIHDSCPHVIKYLLRYICALLFMFQYSKHKFEIIHILNIKRENFFLIPVLRKRCNKIIISVYGRSTYLKPLKRILFAKVYKFVDVFVFSNRAIIKEFSSFNPRVPNSSLIETILPASNISLNIDSSKQDNIQKFINKYNIYPDLVRISCSSTISSNDQHEQVVQALRNLKEKKKVQLMFLLTYGGTSEEQQRIINLIKRDLAGFNLCLLTSFLSNSELAAYRALTDIYINMRSSDQLAGAMIESLFEGAMVISGKWLNYETLDDLDIYYKKVNNFNELTSTINESIEEINEYKNKYSQTNAKKIADTFSMETVLKKWGNIYSPIST